MWFNQYPYINVNDLNLDYLLKAVRELRYQLENFININTIKYANPIQWNITTQYEANTVVIDANDGTAYLSVQPVPSGVALTNADYWTPIFTLNLLSANQNITLRDDGANILATFASIEGDWLIWNNTLYKVTRPININEAYVVGYNLTRYSVELFIRDYIGELLSQIGVLSSQIGDLNDLSTTDKDSLVEAINEIYNMISAVAPIKYFNTVADLRAGNVSVGDLVRTLGYYSANDGGGLDFYVLNNSGGTFTDNAGTIINIGTLSCVNFDSVVNVKAFGARSGYDASAAINAAINAADTIIIDDTYSCSNNMIIKSNKTICGGGSITYDVDIDNTSVQRFNPSIIDVYDCVNTTFKDLTITFNVLNYGSMFRLENCSNLLFDGLKLRFNGTATSVSINAVFDLHNDNHFITVENCDVSLTNAYSTHGGFMWVQYANDNEPTVVKKNSDHIVIRNNKIASSAHDEIIGAYNYYAGVSAIISDVDIVGNTIIRPTGSVELFMVTVFSATDRGVRNVNISGNRFIAETSTASNQLRVIGIDAGSAHNAIVEGVTITDNTFEGNLNNAIIIDSPYAPVGCRVIIADNIIKNTAATNTTYPAFRLNNMTAIFNDNMIDGYDRIITGNNVTAGFYVKNQTSTGMKNLYGDSDNGAIQFMNNDVFAWQTFNISAVNGASEVVEFTQTPVYWSAPTGRPIAYWAQVNANMVVRLTLGTYKKVTVYNYSATAGSVKIFVYIPQPV